MAKFDRPGILPGEEIRRRRTVKRQVREIVQPVPGVTAPAPLAATGISPADLGAQYRARVAAAGQYGGGLPRRVGGVLMPPTFGGDVSAQTGANWAAALQGQNAALAAGTAAGEPNFYGVSEGTLEEFRQQELARTMAPLAAEFGRRGLMSSSMYGQATATAGAEISRDITQIRMAEAARRTEWEQRNAFERWRLQQQGGSMQMQQAQFADELRFRREGQRQAWDMFYGELDWRSRQRMHERWLGAVPSRRAWEQGQQGGPRIGSPEWNRAQYGWSPESPWYTAPGYEQRPWRGGDVWSATEQDWMRNAGLR